MQPNHLIVQGRGQDRVENARPGQSGDGSEWLYAMLILAGVGVLGGHFLFSRFAVAANGA